MADLRIERTEGGRWMLVVDDVPAWQAAEVRAALVGYAQHLTELLRPRPPSPTAYKPCRPVQCGLSGRGDWSQPDADPIADLAAAAEAARSRPWAPVRYPTRAEVEAMIGCYFDGSPESPG